MPKIVDKAQVRDHILNATMQVYAETGLHAATISAIARAAGMGKGTLYLYYESKDALTLALADRVFRDMDTSFMAKSGFKSLEAFCAHLECCMTMSDERADFVRVFFEVFGPSFASDAFVKRVAAFFDRLGAYYASELEGLKVAGETRPDMDTAIAGRCLAAMVDGVTLHRGLFSIPKMRHRKMIKASLDLLIDGMRSKAT